jgi:hypothetical protein
MKTPEFVITDDNGKKKLYVNGYNIWTLKSSECTPDVRQAIMRAYFLGVKDMRQELNIIDIPGDFQCEFKKA